MPDSNDIPYSFDIVRVIQSLFTGSGGTSSGTDPVAGIAALFGAIITTAIHLWQIAMVLGLFFALLCLFGIIYASVRYHQLAEEEARRLKEAELLYAELYRPSEVKNRRWHDALQHINSENPNDWKLAIIEADVMLEELLEVAGYAGLSIGDKLKSASPASFQTVEFAWDAHKIRNRIAHDGTDFVLTKKIAQDTINKYKMVFQEFDFI